MALRITLHIIFEAGTLFSITVCFARTLFKSLSSAGILSYSNRLCLTVSNTLRGLGNAASGVDPEIFGVGFDSNKFSVGEGGMNRQK